MATFSIEIPDADVQTVTSALAFNAGYNAETDGDETTFAIAYVIKIISDIVRAVAVNQIRSDAEVTIQQAVDALPTVVIANPAAPVVVDPTPTPTPVVVDPVIAP